MHAARIRPMWTQRPGRPSAATATGIVWPVTMRGNRHAKPPSARPSPPDLLHASRLGGIARRPASVGRRSVGRWRAGRHPHGGLRQCAGVGLAADAWAMPLSAAICSGWRHVAASAWAGSVAAFCQRGSQLNRSAWGQPLVLSGSCASGLAAPRLPPLPAGLPTAGGSAVVGVCSGYV